MRTSNAMQLKAVVRNKARELGVSAQLVMHDRKARGAAAELGTRSGRPARLEQPL